MRKSFLTCCFLLFFAACDSGVSSHADSSSSTEESSDTISSIAGSSSSDALPSSETPYSSMLLPVSSSSIQTSSSSFKGSSSSQLIFSEGRMTDERDGEVYKTLRVGNLTWMYQNLRYRYLQPTAEQDSSSWCHDSLMCAKYGRLYLWSAAMDSAAIFSDDAKGCGYFATEEEWFVCPNGKDKDVRGICPEGWRMPKYDEFLSYITWRYTSGYEPEDDEEIPLLVTTFYFDSETHKFHVNPADFGIWLATEVNFEKAYHDEFSIYAASYSEGGHIQDGIQPESKKMGYPIQCVKDEQE